MVLKSYSRIVIADLDGTLGDYGHRVRLWKERKYHEFNRAGKDDKPIQPIVDILSCLPRDTAVVVLTARSDDNREMTIKWLMDNDIRFDVLLMREDGDMRSDVKIKQELFEKWIDEDKVWFVLEDRNICVDMWRGLGLTCLQVAPGDF